MASKNLRKRRCLNDVPEGNVDENEGNVATANVGENDENISIENVNESQENVMTTSSSEGNRIVKRKMHDYPPPLNVSIETFYESVDNQLKSINVEWKGEFKKEIVESNFIQSACLNIAKSLYHVCGVFKKIDGLKYVNAFLEKYVYSDHQDTTRELVFKSHRHLRDKYLKCLKENNGIRSNNAFNVDEPFDIHAEAKIFEKSMLKNEEKGLEYSVEHYVERHRIYAASSYEKFFELVPSLSSHTRYLLDSDIQKLNSFNFDLVYEKFVKIEQFISNEIFEICGNSAYIKKYSKKNKEKFILIFRKVEHKCSSLVKVVLLSCFLSCVIKTIPFEKKAKFFIESLMLISKISYRNFKNTKFGFSSSAIKLALNFN